jgi:hypothetical protein
VEQETPERWWTAYMNYIDNEGSPDSRELETFPTKREAKDRVEQEFAQFVGPPCRVLMKDGHPVVETSVVGPELTAGNPGKNEQPLEQK